MGLRVRIDGGLGLGLGFMWKGDSVGRFFTGSLKGAVEILSFTLTGNQRGYQPSPSTKTKYGFISSIQGFYRGM